VKQTTHTAAIIRLPILTKGCGAIPTAKSDITPRPVTFLPERKAKRWADNILLCITYLPHDCVKSMIDMGWHHTT